MYTVFLTGGIGSGKSTVARIMAEHGARVIDTDALAREVLDEPQVKLELARRFGEDVLTWPEGFDMAWALAQVRDGDRAWDDLVAAYGAADSCEDVSEALSRLAREPLDPVEGMCCGTADFAGVNRALLAERAFATPEDTAALNAITHPRIFARLGELLTESPCTGTSAGVVVVEIPLIEASGPGALDLADEIVAVSCPRELRRLRAQGRGMDPEDFDGRDARQIADEERARRRRGHRERRRCARARRSGGCLVAGPVACRLAGPVGGVRCGHGRAAVAPQPARRRAEKPCRRLRRPPQLGQDHTCRKGYRRACGARRGRGVRQASRPCGL